MTDAVIRLDKSRPYSECRGERQVDDPAYRVAYYQGQIVGKDMVLLPFDAHGELVADDGKTEPWQGKDADGKVITHFPLYNGSMRELLEKKRKRQAILAAKPASAEDDEFDSVAARADEVNFESYLRGEARYDWHIMQAAARKRFSRVFTNKEEMVNDLVLDEKIIPVDQLAPALARLLAPKAA